MATAIAEDENHTESSTAEAENAVDSAVFCDGQLSFLGQDVLEIPEALTAEYADKTVRLDLSFNRIQFLHGLEKFEHLHELILDNNELDDEVIFPRLPSLTTLYLNKNRFQEIEPLLLKLKDSFPDIQYLSLLGNAACPNQLSSTEKDDEDYQRYRYFVLFHLPNLKFLDSSSVTQAERIEAKRRGQYMQVVRPTSEDSTTESEESELTPQYRPLPTDPNDQSEPQAARWGKSRSRYLGRNSEGNRFITDLAL